MIQETGQAETNIKPTYEHYKIVRYIWRVFLVWVIAEFRRIMSGNQHGRCVRPFFQFLVPVLSSRPIWCGADLGLIARAA